MKATRTPSQFQQKSARHPGRCGWRGGGLPAAVTIACSFLSVSPPKSRKLSACFEHKLHISRSLCSPGAPLLRCAIQRLRRSVPGSRPQTRGARQGRRLARHRASLCRRWSIAFRAEPGDRELSLVSPVSAPSPPLALRACGRLLRADRRAAEWENGSRAGAPKASPLRAPACCRNLAIHLDSHAKAEKGKKKRTRRSGGCVGLCACGGIRRDGA